MESLAPEQLEPASKSLQMVAWRNLPFPRASERRPDLSPSVNWPRTGNPCAVSGILSVSETKVTVATPSTLVKITTSLSKVWVFWHEPSA